MDTQHAVPADSSGSTTAHMEVLREEQLKWRSLFEAQPPLVQRLLETQAGLIADAYVEDVPHLSFTLPERVVPAPGAAALPVPAASQRVTAGGRGERGRVNLRNRLDELEGSSDPAVALAAGLLRYATAAYMVHNMLPGGRTVVYDTLEGEQIPSVPVATIEEPPSALTAATDAIVEEDTAEGDGSGQESVIVPYVPAARRFYMPQWVAFDEKGHLLVNTSQEAEAYVASMKRFVGILHGAVAITPFFVADEEYQRKRYGILGQLVNQGRALARHQTGEIIETIRAKAAAGQLNRGLSLSLPYFDDQALELRLHNFQVIPSGRVMFVPAFVTRAASLEQAKTAQDTRLSPSTRKYLMEELQMLAEAFLF